MAFCELATALGLAGVLNCTPPEPKKIELPVTDAKVFEYKKPEPKPEAKPYFPPIIIKKEVIKEVIPSGTRTLTQVEEKELKKIRKQKKEIQTKRETELKRIYEQRQKSASLSTIKGKLSDIDKLAPIPGDTLAKLENLKYKAPHKKTDNPISNKRIITTDRVISGILETGINSQLTSNASTVIVQTDLDVFGYHGRNILIPKGSRLMCKYSGMDKQGLSRISLSCERILLGENRAEIYKIKTNGTDKKGNLGISGLVDNRFFEKYGTAFILAGISATVRAAAQRDEDTSPDSKSGAMIQTGTEELAQKFGEISAQVLEKKVNLNPILIIQQGTRIKIRPSNDWYIARSGEKPS